MKVAVDLRSSSCDLTFRNPPGEFSDIAAPFIRMPGHYTGKTGGDIKVIKSRWAAACDYYNVAPRTAAGKVKVLHIISDLSIGGAEMMLYKMLTKTDRDRFEPAVLSLIDRGALRSRIEKLGIRVHTVNFRPNQPSLLGFLRLVRFMKRLQPDFVQGWMYHGCLAAQLGKFLLPRTRAFWSIHYSSDSFASEKLLTAAVIRICAPLSRLADQIIFVSRASQIQHERFGYSLRCSCVIPNGINTSEFVPSKEARASVRSELGLSQDAVLIGMMGRYHPMKDHANFLQAAALVSRKYPAANFVLIGQGVDDQNPELARWIRDLGLTGQVRLLGQRADIPRIAAALDIFSLSSAYGESCPNVIGEAMACEVPCAVTDLGDASWIVGDTGRVVRPRDPRALAEACAQLIELGAAGRQSLGRAARARVSEHFRIETIVTRYEALYTTIPTQKQFGDLALTTMDGR